VLLVLEAMKMERLSMASSSPSEVVASIQSGMTVYLHGAAATPLPLVEALAARTDLRDVRIVHLHTEGTAPHVAPGTEGCFRGRPRGHCMDAVTPQ